MSENWRKVAEEVEEGGQSGVNQRKLGRVLGKYGFAEKTEYKVVHGAP